jgi:photosystem II stability/assembly factor-like uncharacterized protein
LTAADSGRPTSWAFLDNGLEETVPLALASPPAGAHLLSGVGDIDGFRHDNLDASPSNGSFAGPRFSNTEGIAFAAKSPQIIVRVGTSRDEVVHSAISDDGGKTWQPLAGEPVPGETGGAAAISCDGKTIVWTTRRSVPHLTANRGKTWPACSGLAQGIRVVADPANPALFYAFDAAAGRLFASTNGAASFACTEFTFGAARETRSGFRFDISGRADLSAAPGAEGDLWLAFGSNGLWHSTNGGAGFARVENVNDAVALGFGKPPADKTFPALFLFGKIGAQQGIFRSDDAGQKWIRLNDDAHQFGWITMITGDPRVFGRVYLATAGRGIIYGDPVSVEK